MDAKKSTVKSDKRKPPNINNGKKGRIAFAILLVMFFSTGVALAQLGGGQIVYDPTVNATLKTNFFQTIEQLLKQYKEQIFTQEYWQIIHGHWQNPLKIVNIEHSAAAALGVDLNLNNLGWRITNYGKQSATTILASDLNDLEEVMNGKRDVSGMASLGNDIDDLYGNAPDTTAGAKVEAANRQIAESAAFTGESNQSIEEMLKNADQLKSRIESGENSPGDLERLQVLEADLRLRAQLLQTQAQNQQTRLQMHLLGIQAAQEGRVEKARLEDRYERLSPQISFGLANSQDLGGNE